jgi:S-adenosylmethionine:tRNA ribosyltransferase-isomerase
LGVTDTPLKIGKKLTLRDFSFHVPEDQVAQKPLHERDSSRLLVWDGSSIRHSQTVRLSEEIPKGSLIIVNDSRVIASRLLGSLPSGGAVELLLLEPTHHPKDQSEAWLCLGKPIRKLSEGTTLHFADGLSAKVLRPSTSTGSGPAPFLVELNLKGPNLLAWLEDYGQIPLPPYISRKDSNEDTRSQDKERYQTVYANDAGSVAAPTAGLHFSNRIIDSLKANDCRFAHVTLHVGAGTFLPVKTEDPSEHVMHSERFLVPKTTLNEIELAQKEGRKVIVVGTTALRTLEGLRMIANETRSSYEQLTDTWLRTDIFIKPQTSVDRFKPWCANALMTNFHQPESTLFMLICALVGYEEARKIYEDAISSGYRFFSYGDSSLLWL